MAESTVLDSAFRYIDKKGNLLRTRTELTVSQMLDFLDVPYEYDCMAGGERASFGTEKGIIQVIDSDEDVAKYERIKKTQKVMAIGHARHAAKIKELEEITYYDKSPQTGSIFLEDPSFSFDYAHILPLVEKCSILHGHTSSVMVELVGQMKDNLLLDFGAAKKIIKEVIEAFDHKFFINEEYLESGDDSHHVIKFDGPRGRFELQVPRDTTYLLEGEATVENLSFELIKLLAPRMPPNIEAVGVYIYEGYNKGSHIISKVR
ncbi:MAG: 6-pyruvoyl tetrahydropterin synthase [Nitrosopumilus sp. H8]|nr:MAG: 6-pyruvoyl tetrahydropterin synthase [Nitrosopumilus sp. H13]RNJ78800.1 MAG: 6-pyruvoyl tetrahydropterin synthase [Nitrosopumilus sp. H8]